MDIKICDNAALRNIDPASFCKTLDHEGFIKTQWAGRGLLYKRGHEESIILPASMQWSDYAVMMADALRLFAKFTGRSQIGAYALVSGSTIYVNPVDGSVHINGEAV